MCEMTNNKMLLRLEAGIPSSSLFVSSLTHPGPDGCEECVLAAEREEDRGSLSGLALITHQGTDGRGTERVLDR